VREEKATCTVAPDYEATGRAAASARTSARRPRLSWPTRSIKSDLARNWPLACAAAPGLSLPQWPQSSCLPRAHGAAFKLGPVASAPGSEFTAGAARPGFIHRPLGMSEARRRPHGGSRRRAVFKLGLLLIGNLSCR
jgi:hypothetical protein